MTDRDIAEAYLKFFKDRFYGKINPSEYILSYSGGKDSHLLYWIIKEYLHEDAVEIVGVNTGFEIPEIRDRILKNCDVVLRPAMKPMDIKEKYGIPCFSKQQDEYIYRYQHGSRSENTMNAVLGRGRIFVLNKTARRLLLSGELHPVSNKCCLWNKEKPLQKYCKEHGKKSIIGVRQSESQTRRAKYTSCMKSNSDFTPLYDWSDDLVDLVYRVFQIEIPQCYQYVVRTGCAGCPYGRHIETELGLLPDGQRKNTIKYFKESYDVLGVDYENKQMTLYDAKRKRGGHEEQGTV